MKKIIYIFCFLLFYCTGSLLGNNDRPFKYIINFSSGISFINPEKYNQLYLEDFLNSPPIENGIDFNINFGYNLYKDFIINLGVGYFETFYTPKREWVDFSGSGTNVIKSYLEITPELEVKYINLRLSKMFNLKRIYPEFGIDLKYNFFSYNTSVYWDIIKTTFEEFGFNDSALSCGLFFNIKYRIWKGLLLGIETSYDYLVFDELKDEGEEIWYLDLPDPDNPEKVVVDLSGIKISLKLSYMI